MNRAIKAVIVFKKCNFNCSYCLHKNKLIGDENVDHIKKFIVSVHEAGIKELQWTGGEPTFNIKRLLSLIKFANKQGLYQSLSSNGSFKSDYVESLKQAGLSRVNISLDTLDKNLYKKITGKDCLYNVIENINIASHVFSEPTKVNTVVTKQTLPGILQIYKKYFGNRKIIPRFHQLSDKALYQSRSRVGIPMILDALGIKEKKEITPNWPIGTNPIALYYVSQGKTFGIVPQTMQCNYYNCNKIWYIDSSIYSCSMKRPDFKVRDNLTEKIYNFINSENFKQLNVKGHFC